MGIDTNGASHTHTHTHTHIHTFVLTFWECPYMIDNFVSQSSPQAIPFYTDMLGFTLIDTFDFPQYKFSLYFLTTIPEGETYDLTPGTQEAHDYLWSMEGVALELTHNHGTENDDEYASHPGNQERDGFGHVAVK